MTSGKKVLGRNVDGKSFALSSRRSKDTMKMKAALFESFRASITDPLLKFVPVIKRALGKQKHILGSYCNDLPKKGSYYIW